MGVDHGVNGDVLRVRCWFGCRLDIHRWFTIPTPLRPDAKRMGLDLGKIANISIEESGITDTTVMARNATGNAQNLSYRRWRRVFFVRRNLSFAPRHAKTQNAGTVMIGSRTYKQQA